MEVGFKEQFLWSERYRPRTIASCILPEDVKQRFQDFVDKGEIPHLLLTGTAGVGKTTVAKALCEELKCDYIVINGSLDNGIDVLRTRITNFASTVSLSSEATTKVVIIDEADYLNPTSTQPALRGFMQDYAQNCRFIFTCNFEKKIIPPLHSRTVKVDFKLEKSVKPEMAAQFMKRTETILKEEGIEYNKKAVAQLLTRHFPDFRKVLNDLQNYASSGVIDEGILLSSKQPLLTDLIDALRAKDFKKMRQWVVNNSDQDPPTLFRIIYDNMFEYVSSGSIPQLVMLLNDYQFKAVWVADQELNLVACFTECMAAVEMK